MKIIEYFCYSGNFTTVILPYPGRPSTFDFDLTDEFVITEFGSEVLFQFAGLVNVELDQIPTRWLDTTNGEIRAETAKMNNTLKMLLPTTFPIQSLAGLAFNPAQPLQLRR